MLIRSLALHNMGCGCTAGSIDVRVAAAGPNMRAAACCVLGCSMTACRTGAGVGSAVWGALHAAATIAAAARDRYVNRGDIILQVLYSLRYCQNCEESAPKSLSPTSSVEDDVTAKPRSTTVRTMSSSGLMYVRCSRVCFMAFGFWCVESQNRAKAWKTMTERLSKIEPLRHIW